MAYTLLAYAYFLVKIDYKSLIFLHLYFLFFSIGLFCTFVIRERYKGGKNQ